MELRLLLYVTLILQKFKLTFVFLGKDYESSLLSRLSYSSLQDFQEILSTISNRVPFTETIKLAFMFCVLVR